MTRPIRFALACLVLPFAGAAATSPAQAASWTVSVRNLGPGVGEAPVLAEVPASVPAGRYRLEPKGGRADVRPAVVLTDAGKTYLGAVFKDLPARGSLEFTLRPDAESGAAKPGVVIRPGSKNLDVSIDGKPLTIYRTDIGTKPILFPLVGPTGVPITRAYPSETVEGEDRDHPHQRSAWFTHGNVNGFDFWASDPLNKPNPKLPPGSIRETARSVAGSGGPVGLLRTSDDWLGPDGKSVCSDERVVTFYDTAEGRVFDFDVLVKATAGPVTFGDTKEGMFGFRVASSMDVNKKKGGKITNAEGLTDDAAWGKASRWVDYTGPVAGQTVGIAVLNHPDSFRFPTTWHVRTYGLFAANPFGWHDFGQKTSGEYSVPAGKSIAFRYRVILHKGETASAKVDEAFRAYAAPPTVEVTAD